MKQLNKQHLIFYVFALYLLALIIAQFFVSTTNAYEVNLGVVLKCQALTTG